MTTNAITARGLSKKYVIHHRQRPSYSTLREAITQGVAELGRMLIGRMRPSEPPEDFWALREIDFDIAPGDVVGVVGRNGSGKSTLLKIISRITTPTRGYVELRGRVASLLEVGTGFHHELTGRENIYLNGSILGMTREEIKRKFDEIVHFAEVDRFLDTPVKRYSNGMYTRLAFAVAAHLEPEILVVDEVLSVGDAEFQRKCLGKMRDVAGQGRTVLFVSHNMPMVESLCSRALLLSQGALVMDRPTQVVLAEYLKHQEESAECDVAERTDRRGIGGVRVTGLTIENSLGEPSLKSGDAMRVTIAYEGDQSRVYRFLIGIYDQSGSGLFRLDSFAAGAFSTSLPRSGAVTCLTEPLNITPGTCIVNVAMLGGNELMDHVIDATTFEVHPADVLGNGVTFVRAEAAWIVRQNWQQLQ